MLDRERFVVYGDTGNHGFDQRTLDLTNQVTNLNLRFSHIWHSRWADKEPGFRMERPDEIEGRHALVFSCPTTNKLELELRDIVVSCKHQYHATSVTVIMSFLRYRRQDHLDKQHEITRLRWFIRDLAHWGVDRLIVCEPHSRAMTEQFCREYGIQLHISDPTELFSQMIKPVAQTLGMDKVWVFSPDFGSVGRAMALAETLNCEVVAAPKLRINGRIEDGEQTKFLADVAQMYGNHVPVSLDLGRLAGGHVIMREDELSSGRTAVSRAERLRRHNVQSVRLAVTHPVCSLGWKTTLFPYDEPEPFEGIWLGNTRPRGDEETEYEGSTGGRIKTVDLAPVIADTLVRVLKRIKD